VNITADTNVLLRAVLWDDEAQGRAASAALEGANRVAISLTSLCEFAWVLARVYRTAPADIAAAIRRLTNAETAVVNRPAVDMGLAMLEAGGDFADGVIAHEGAWLGGETFVSFDRQAVSLLAQQGRETLLLA
jgi:predicted nucleic-acid-binding protein